MREDNRSNSGVSFGGILGITFIILKLTGVIDWSWWWVFAPLWGGIALWVLFICIVALITIVLDKLGL